MNDMDLLDSQKIEKLKAIFDKMTEEAELGGVLFANREGGIITHNFEKNSELRNFSSMCASVLESAEEMGKIINDKKIDKIVAELDDKTILIIKYDNSAFLTLIIESFSKIGLIIENLDEYFQQIRNYY